MTHKYTFTSELPLSILETLSAPELLRNLLPESLRLELKLREAADELEELRKDFEQTMKDFNTVLDERDEARDALSRIRMAVGSAA